MNKYKRAKIYKLVSKRTKNFYIGSTIKKDLSIRLSKHKHAFRRFYGGKSNNYLSAFEILKYPDAKIVLLEKYPTTSKDKLRRRERQWIEKYKHKLVNIYIPIIDKK